MGNQNSHIADQHNEHITLNVANLNYSGILKSPYEFYENDADGIEKAEIGSIFYKLVEEEGEKFEWDFGKLDKFWQEKRYSPLYQPSCGINNIFMMNRREF